MTRRLFGGARLAAMLLAFALVLISSGQAFAHARYERAEPPLDVPLTGEALVLKVYFSQELTSRSTIRVLDAYGVQVDLGDGRVDLDDPIRKTMLVSLPELPVGLYTLDFSAESAEDGHEYPGTVAFGVGLTPPSGDQPGAEPAAAPTTEVESWPNGQTLDAVRPIAY
jgi:methionine-rich copper-binding protein CopC